MSTSDLLQRMPAVLIFSLTFTFLTGTVTASENSVGRIPFLISNEDEVLVVSQEASAISEQASSSWTGLSSLKFGEQEDTSSVGTPGSLAQVYLKRLAEEEAWKKGKEKWGKGPAALGLGVLLTVAGVYLVAGGEDIGSEYDLIAGAGLIGSGLLMSGAGVYYLNRPGRVKRQIDRLLRITDPVQREGVGQETLASLAHGARVARILSASSFGVLAVMGYAMGASGYGWDFVWIGSMGYVALNLLTSKSPEEMTFQKYLEESKQGQEVGLHLGIDPSGRVQVALVLSF